MNKNFYINTYLNRGRENDRVEQKKYFIKIEYRGFNLVNEYY